MKFKYKKFSSTILRPIIPVGIGYDSQFIQYEVLVDSGADVCIFDAEIGEALGIDIQSGEKNFVSGVTGVPEHYFVHEVNLKIGGYSFPTKVGFLYNIGKNGYGIVGQKGFFETFTVKFDLVKETLELKEHQP